MRSLKPVIPAVVLILMLSACTAFRPDPGARIIGNWQSVIGGYPVVVSYTDTTVQIGSAEPVTYMLDGNRLTFAEGKGEERMLSFPSRNEMVQTDPLTETAHRFTRVR